MDRDEEFRKVAEDIGALARSLGRDFREAVDQAMRGGSGPGGAVRHGLRGFTDEARRGMRTGWDGAHHLRRGHRWSSWGYGDWGNPAGGSAPRPGAPDGADPEHGPAGRPPPPRGARGRGWSGPGVVPDSRPWAGPAGPHPQRRRGPMPPVRHRWDATTVAGILAVLFGIAWLIGAVGVLHVPVEGVVAVGLMLLGASLVVTGRTDWSLSRRSWPMWLGAGLIVVLITTSSTFGLGGALDAVSFGNKTVTVAGTSWPSGTVHGGFGNLTVDLPQTTLARSETLTVASVAGDTIVDLPEYLPYNVIVNARAAAGRICVAGSDESNGVAPQYHQALAGGPGASARTLTLDIHQVFGQILIDGQECGH